MNIMKKYVIFPFLLILFWKVTFCKSIDVLSPGSSIKVTLNLADKIDYSVSSNNQILFDNSSLMLKLSAETLGANPKLAGKKISAINEIIHREISLRNAHVNNNCNVLLLNFKGDYSVEFRAYNDGVAYRFITKKNHPK